MLASCLHMMLMTPEVPIFVRQSASAMSQAPLWNGQALLMTGLALLVALMISFIITAVYVNFSAIYGVRRAKITHIYIYMCVRCV